MRKSVVFLFIIIISTVQNGCVLSKSPNVNSVSVPIGEQKIFTLSVFPQNATFVWTLDGASVTGQGKSYQYTATGGEHSLKVTATHFLGSDKQTWTITDAAVKPCGGRLLGIDITQSQSGTYDDAFNIVKSIGNEFVTLTLDWDMVEISPGEYDDTWLDVANLYYPAQGMKLALILSSADTVNDRRPSDLRLLAWNNVSVVQRYKHLIDHALSRLPAVDLMLLSIGSEVDVFLGADTEKWTEYTDFYNQTSAYVKTKVSAQTTVGIKTTFDGTVTNRTSLVQMLNTNSEAIFITYYPLNANFTVKNPDVVIADFASLIALYPGRKILFLEAGYPSGTLCESSEELQRRFVVNMFSAWDAYDDIVTAVNFEWLHDLTQSQVDMYAGYFGIPDPRFKEYLKTLGLRYSNGSEKAAFVELATQADARGW
jgi:hypothetical protein